MTEWSVVGVIVVLAGLALSIGGPVLKLNSTISRLIARLDHLDADTKRIELKNNESHDKLWKRSDEQDEKLADHEKRIYTIEKKGVH